MSDIEKGEIHILELLTKYDKEITSTNLVSSINRMKFIKENSHFPDCQKIQISGPKDSSCFRIDLTYPVILMISPEISRFKKIVTYYKSYTAYMPVYLCQFNILTMFKTWNEFASKIQGPTSNAILKNMCLKLSPRDQKPQYSSLNFILRRDALLEEETNSLILNLVYKYFRFFYWNLPGGRSYNDTLILNDFYSIHSVHRLSKTLFIIDEIGSNEEIFVDNIHLKLKHAKVRRLVRQDNKFELQTVNCLVNRHVIENIPLERIHRTVINGLFNNISINRITHSILTDVLVDIHKNSQLISAVFGLVTSCRFDDNGNTELGIRSEIEKEVFRVASLFEDMLSHEGITDHRIVLFDGSLRFLSPIVIENNEMIFYFHPCFLSFLLQIKKYEFLNLSDGMIDLIKILYYDRKDARFSLEMEHLKKTSINSNIILNAIPILKNMMMYSQILRK